MGKKRGAKRHAKGLQSQEVTDKQAKEDTRVAATVQSKNVEKLPTKADSKKQRKHSIEEEKNAVLSGKKRQRVTKT